MYVPILFFLKVLGYAYLFDIIHVYALRHKETIKSLTADELLRGLSINASLKHSFDEIFPELQLAPNWTIHRYSLGLVYSP